MAKYHQRSSKWDSTLLALWGRADSGRWVGLEGHPYCIPHKKYQATLNLLHEGHLGLNKCKLRTKDIVYWPDLNEQLEKLVLNCELCLKYSHSKCQQKPSSSLGEKIPVYPWTKLATDIFHFESSCYLLIVNYASRFQVVHTLSLRTGLHIANQCKQVFSEYGWPETLISDNGPCYTLQAFTSVMQPYSVNHIISSPHYPQSNGLAKKYVQIVKSFFLESKRGRQRFLHVIDDLLP